MKRPTEERKRHCAIGRREKFRVFSERTRLHNFQRRSSGTKTPPSRELDEALALELLPREIDPARSMLGRKAAESIAAISRQYVVSNKHVTDH